jgi:hypothetical protein
MSTRLVLLLLLGFSALVVVYFLFKLPRAVVQLGNSNGDVIKSYSLALDVAHKWHWGAYPGSLNITTEPNGQVILTTYFYGKGLLQRHTDVLTVDVDMSTQELLASHEAKGGLEPSYDNARPMTVNLASDWREVLSLADHAYGSGFKQRFTDASATVSIETDRWYVTYASEPPGNYVHLTVFDITAHPSLANTVNVNDSGIVRPPQILRTLP